MSTLAELEARVAKLERAQGKPGAGVCICKASPEEREANSVRMGTTWAVDSKSRFATSACLDHRCPIHGEKAQPALWGRHKEKELFVTYAQWTSLGITHEETQK